MRWLVTGFPGPPQTERSAGISNMPSGQPSLSDRGWSGPRTLCVGYDPSVYTVVFYFFECRLTDEELVRACGGRTGHKGARHGVTMSAKLIRLEEQERQFLAKYGQGRQSGTAPERPRGRPWPPGERRRRAKQSGGRRSEPARNTRPTAPGARGGERKYKGVSQAEGRTRLGGEPDAEVPSTGEWQFVPERGSKGRENKWKRKRRNRQIADQLPQNESDLECGNVAKRKKKRRSEVE
ncbi:G patch domain-containing protein 4 [Heterodontus francisci]|uniref:G patch domain-containing protein 4 n=1 Tax=Heterodontus francisci TaxID=7792 RepID=UPI00355C2597